MRIPDRQHVGTIENPYIPGSVAYAAWAKGYLAGSGPGYAERCPSCGRADEHAAPCTAKVRLPAQSLAEFQAEHPDEFAGSGPETGLREAVQRYIESPSSANWQAVERLAATPTASPTATGEREP